MRLTLLRKSFSIPLALLILAAACVNPKATALPEATPTASPTPAPQTIWFSPAVPAALREEVLAETSLTPQTEQAGADVRLVVQPPTTSSPPGSTWIYALVAPFPTIPDGVSLEDLRGAWAGERRGPFFGRPLWMEESTRSAISALWGEPGPDAVRIVEAGSLLDSAWADWPSWGIVPFEELQPRWKVLTVDGQSPIHKDFDASTWPLAVPFQVEPAVLPLPPGNRDPGRMTVLVMTGVTALVRATAARMETKGVTYPGEDIRDWLVSADITHISNEISFVEGCPPPNFYSQSLVFCSDPKYMELLQYVGTDVVELTGNHMNDWGISRFRASLDLYDQYNLPTFGGGRNLEDAFTPLIIENNGNRLAFIGCNSSPVEAEMATETDPGSAPCGDYAWMTQAIAQLKSEGYLPIATFQYHEYYTYVPPENMLRDFRPMAEAGAAIVSGSQSHYPMGMEFNSDAFIHYGLGNLFFDQMNYEFLDGTTTTVTRQEFIDRYVIYDNKVISVELLTAMLEDYAKPRPMTDTERAELLEKVFSASGWR